MFRSSNYCPLNETIRSALVCDPRTPTKRLQRRQFAAGKSAALLRDCHRPFIGVWLMCHSNGHSQSDGQDGRYYQTANRNDSLATRIVVRRVRTGARVDELYTAESRCSKHGCTQACFEFQRLQPHARSPHAVNALGNVVYFHTALDGVPDSPVCQPHQLIRSFRGPQDLRNSRLTTVPNGNAFSAS
jgi:hypothetical protein